MLIRDLDERVDHAVAQLRDLQLQESRIEPVFFAMQRAELEGRAATAMRDRDVLRAGGAATTDTIDAGPDRVLRIKQAEVTSTVAWFDSHRWARPGLMVLGTAVVLGVLAYALQTEQHERAPQRAPMQASAQQGPDPELQGLIARLNSNPKDIEAMLALLKRLLRAQMFEEAAQMLARVKALDPENSSAKVYEAVMMAARGEGTTANAQLDSIAREHPDLPDAWFFRGMLAMQAGDTPRMRDSFEHYVAVAPAGAQKDRVKMMLANAPQ
ncbi:MAG: hypothetical protein H7Z43_04565 [Clostridia bacterium]|nr:hypothetical protein [Deltaproteobacteria bacterium]